MTIWRESDLAAHPCLDRQQRLAEEPFFRELLQQWPERACVYRRAGEIQGFSFVDGSHVVMLYAALGQYRKGIGLALMTDLKDRHERLVLNVFTCNGRALMFYQAQDFKVEYFSVDAMYKTPTVRMRWARSEVV